MHVTFLWPPFLFLFFSSPQFQLVADLFSDKDDVTPAKSARVNVRALKTVPKAPNKEHRKTVGHQVSSAGLSGALWCFLLLFSHISVFLVPDVSASAHGHPECYDSSLRALHQTQRLQRGLLVSQLVSFSIWIKGSDLRLYTLSQFKMLTSSLWRSPTGRAGLISQRSWRTGSAWAWEHRPAQTGSTSN